MVDSSSENKKSNPNLTDEEKKHVKLAQDNNGTYTNFISKYGDKPIGQVSNADP